MRQKSKEDHVEPEQDDVPLSMMRCYLSQKRVSWPYLAILFVAMAFLVVAPLLLR